MFKQLTDLSGNEWYLIASLWIFLAFFITVGIMLFRMPKDDVNYMKGLPVDETGSKDDDLTN
ncbi:hypothetical protein GCM10007415_21970 [Parapedobacter pyrenivorans]|uniref:Cbb3-type cytochrome oxidase component FixQ n=1 Tax=Parapedobacter pyrenivorans TaxID=1305674 RepID=A0A917HS64_9SPHI|nr:hypothetical protein [Parapedobacter pyrenivorans]GGG87707.1 hypothetical protein GCM10007415_21970 [Parapedobacter pyrenivorans]